MDKMREDFEKWAVEKSMLLDLDVVSGQVVDWYRCDITDDAWELWKASRAALVVELPKIKTSGDLIFYEAKDVLDALDKVGIKYE